MRKASPLSFISSFLFVLFAAFNALSSEQEQKIKAETLLAHSSFDDIRKRGVLRVAMHKKDHPPFFMVDEKGELIGVDVEIAKEIAKQLDLALEINRDAETFDEVVKRVSTGLSDIAVSKLSMTLTRAQIVRYTKPYSSLSKSVLLNRVRLLKFGEGTSVEQIFNNKEAIIGVLSGSSYEDFAKRLFSDAKLYGRSDWTEDIVPKVVTGEVWGAFRDELEVRRTMFLYKDASYHLLAINLKDEQDPIMMVVHKDAAMFQNWLDLYLSYVHRREDIKDSIKRFEKYVYKK